ncbi:hypothetical protein CLOM_g21347 [Closterium sp. NIES-68]|nr:hypothetical protein CLOM_g21347 [Closterium sp. NIES-68]
MLPPTPPHHPSTALPAARATAASDYEAWVSESAAWASAGGDGRPFASVAGATQAGPAGWRGGGGGIGGVAVAAGAVGAGVAAGGVAMPFAPASQQALAYIGPQGYYEDEGEVDGYGVAMDGRGNRVMGNPTPLLPLSAPVYSPYPPSFLSSTPMGNAHYSNAAYNGHGYSDAGYSNAGYSDAQASGQEGYRKGNDGQCKPKSMHVRHVSMDDQGDLDVSDAACGGGGGLAEWEQEGPPLLVVTGLPGHERVGGREGGRGEVGRVRGTSPMSPMLRSAWRMIRSSSLSERQGEGDEASAAAAAAASGSAGAGVDAADAAGAGAADVAAGSAGSACGGRWGEGGVRMGEGCWMLPHQ